MYRPKKLGKLRISVEVFAVLLASLAFSLLMVEAATIGNELIGEKQWLTVSFVVWITASGFIRVVKMTQAAYAYMWGKSKLLASIRTGTFITMAYGMLLTVFVIAQKFNTPTGHLLSGPNFIVVGWFMFWMFLDLWAVYKEDIYYIDPML